MMTHALQKYLNDNSISQGDFADKIGVSRITVHRIIHRKGRHSMDLIEKVVAATGGKVSITDFFSEAA